MSFLIYYYLRMRLKISKLTNEKKDTGFEIAFGASSGSDIVDSDL